MLEGIDVNQRIEYSSIEDTEDPKTIFVFRPFNREEVAKISKMDMYDYLSMGIVEIKNFAIKGTIREQLVSIKNQEVVVELLEKIGAINGMTEQDKKN